MLNFFYNPFIWNWSRFNREPSDVKEKQLQLEAYYSYYKAFLKIVRFNKFTIKSHFQRNMRLEQDLILKQSDLDSIFLIHSLKLGSQSSLR